MNEWLAIAAMVFPFACYQRNPDVGIFIQPMHRQTAALADIQTCRIYVNTRPVWKLMNRKQKCTVILHEYGHLAGLNHSHNKRSIMYTHIINRVDRRCKHVR